MRPDLGDIAISLTLAVRELVVWDATSDTAVGSRRIT